MGKHKVCWIILTLLAISKIEAHSIESTTEENSKEEELISAKYILPKQIFNDGKPFYVDKDPISGQLDFSSKKPAGIEPEINEVIDPKEKTIVLSSVSPNFHDFLNLPVKYSSSKFVYPLVSSSYANLKYQGNNKNFVSNHKNYSASTPTTSSPKYYTLNKSTPSKSKPTPMRPSEESSSWRPTKTTISDKITTKEKLIPTKKIFITDKPIFEPTVSPTKLIPSGTSTKNPTTIENITRPLSTTPRPIKIKFSTDRAVTSSNSIPVKITTDILKITTSTQRPISDSDFKINKTIEISTSPKPFKISRPSFSVKSTKATTIAPITKTTTTTTLKPTEKTIPTTTVNPTFSTVDIADAYNVIGNKKESNTMTLTDLFNALADEESQTYKPSQVGFDSKGNLMQPFLPAKPAPFTLHQVTKTSILPNLIPSLNPTSTTTETILHAVPDQEADNYVRYEVQQPNMMQLQYQPIPSMNNIVISPGQQSASFVLGSQQSVGANNFVGSVEKEPLFQNGQRIQYGTVINEDISLAMRPQSPTLNISQAEESFTSNKQHIPERFIETESYNKIPTTSVKFPNDISAPKPASFNTNSDIVNGHAQPVALPHIQANPVVFPQNENSWKTENIFDENSNSALKIVFKDENNPGRIVPQRNEILSLNQYNNHNQVTFPQLPEGLTPPQQRPEEHINSHLTSAPPHLFNEFTRKPLPGLHRSNPERPLPNILPQFRPNAKISNTHPLNKDSGNIRIHQKLPYPNRSLPPPFAHRRTPIGGRYNQKINNEAIEANRRVYRLPPPHPLERIYLQRPAQVHSRVPPPVRYVNTFGMERHPINADIYDIPSTDVKPDRLPAFEEEDLIVEDPPKLVMDKEVEVPKLEPVVTLQMLKTQRKPQSEAPAQADIAPQTQKTNGQSPVYVVYPVKSSPLHMDMFDSTDIEDPIVVGHRGEQPPQPPLDRDISADYQNTPFSVVRDQPQEPILMAKNKSQTNKNNFPYPLEKPDPALVDLKGQTEIDRFDRDPNIEILPRVVNRVNAPSSEAYKDTEIPIAIAYTPTEANKQYHGPSSYDKYSHPNLASPVIPEIRDTQTEATISEEIDTRGQYFEKDFMAPFYPSMSLNSVTNSPNGWSVYSATTDGLLYEKNNINRIDHVGLSHMEDNTQKFDPDNFQPELQGGFKPIYPPGYKMKDSSEDELDKEMEKLESSFSITNSSTQILSTTTTTTQSTITTTTEKPTDRKKSKLEASIESLLFGDDDDFEDDEVTEKSNINTSS